MAAYGATTARSQLVDHIGRGYTVQVRLKPFMRIGPAFMSPFYFLASTLLMLERAVAQLVL